MSAILYALGMFVTDLFTSRCRLEAENLLLRHQLTIALRRARPRLRLLGSDRALLIWMTRLLPSLLDAVQVRCFLWEERSRSLGLGLLEKSGGVKPSSRSLNDCMIVKKGAASLGFSCLTAMKRPTARQASFAPSRPPSPSFSKVSEAYQRDSINSR
jgi:hypothetical protein